MGKDKIRNARNFEELLNIKYGEIGIKRRDDFEERDQYYVISIERTSKRGKNDSRTTCRKI